jgi:hypothetical protein
MDVVRCSRQLGSASPGVAWTGPRVVEPREFVRRGSIVPRMVGVWCQCRPALKKRLASPSRRSLSFSVPRSGFSFLLKRPKRTVLKRGMVVRGFSMMPDERRREETGVKKKGIEIPISSLFPSPIDRPFHQSCIFRGRDEDRQLREPSEVSVAANGQIISALALENHVVEAAEGSGKYLTQKQKCDGTRRDAQLRSRGNGSAVRGDAKKGVVVFTCLVSHIRRAFR